MIVRMCSCVMVCIDSLTNLCTPYTVEQGFGVTLGRMECRVAYLLGADKYLGPLASHLSGGSQPVISTRSVFSTLLPSLLADI